MGLDALTDLDNNTVSSRKRSIGRSASRLKYKDSDFVLLSPYRQGKKTKGPLLDPPPGQFRDDSKGASLYDISPSRSPSLRALGIGVDFAASSVGSEGLRAPLFRAPG